MIFSLTFFVGCWLLLGRKSPSPPPPLLFAPLNGHRKTTALFTFSSDARYPFIPHTELVILIQSWKKHSTLSLSWYHRIITLYRLAPSPASIPEYRNLNQPIKNPEKTLAPFWIKPIHTFFNAPFSISISRNWKQSRESSELGIGCPVPRKDRKETHTSILNGNNEPFFSNPTEQKESRKTYKWIQITWATIELKSLIRCCVQLRFFLFLLLSAIILILSIKTCPGCFTKHRADLKRERKRMHEWMMNSQMQQRKCSSDFFSFIFYYHYY